MARPPSRASPCSSSPPTVCASPLPTSRRRPARATGAADPRLRLEPRRQLGQHAVDEDAGHAGFRVVALDNRGHGQSQKLYEPAAYTPPIMAEDARRAARPSRASSGPTSWATRWARGSRRISRSRHPDRIRSLLMGGLGIHLVEGVGLPLGIADAMEAPSADALADPTQRRFRLFAEQTKSDLKALAACIRGSRQSADAGGGRRDHDADADRRRHQGPGRGRRRRRSPT